MGSFTDYGGDGGVFKQKGATQGVCVSCGKHTYMSKLAWSRATRPACSACGGLLEPSANAQRGDVALRTTKRKERKERRCTACNAVLSIRNSSSVCRPCSANRPTRPDFLNGFAYLRDEIKKAAPGLKRARI